jgi:hypothetical protein
MKRLLYTFLFTSLLFATGNAQFNFQWALHPTNTNALDVFKEGLDLITVYTEFQSADMRSVRIGF